MKHFNDFFTCITLLASLTRFLINYFKYVIYREWKKLGVKVQMSSEKINSQAKVHKLINDAACLGCVDGIIVDATNVCGSETEEIRSTIHNLDIVSRKLFLSLRYVGT